MTAQWGTVEQRFWKNVDSSGGLDACWPWLAYRDADGYGKIAYDGITSKSAHRLALSLSGVDVRAGVPVLHSCDNPPCVNPAHLRVGTVSENTRDKFARGREPAWMRPWTHCKRGHAVEGDNVVMVGRYKRCRTCRTAWEARRADSRIRSR